MPHPPKVPLIQAPTPLHRLDNLSRELGLDLWIKRDDLTGFALGGNKGRKLEYLIAEALRQGATAVVTCGALQSNFIRQLAAACSMHGLICAAAVMAVPFEEGVSQPLGPRLSSSGGNVLIDRILGVDLRVHPDSTWEALYRHAEDLALEYEARGSQVYRIPVGGSSPLGAYALLQAGLEVQAQAAPFDWIVFSSSSGSTQVGLCHAFLGSPTRILGVAADPEPEIVNDFAALSDGLAALTGGAAVLPEQFQLNLEFVGPGYGVPSAAGNEAIRSMARREGIFLDPIYSAKAFAALAALAGQGSLSGRVLFWHTGGVPTLFAMDGIA